MRGEGSKKTEKKYEPRRFKFTVKEIRRRIRAFREAHPEIDWELDRRYKPPTDEQ